MHAHAPEGFEREMGPGGLEVRSVGASAHRLEARASDTGERRIKGYGAVYEVSTEIEGWFSSWTEEIARGAAAKTIKEGDARSMFNHDTNWLLGRVSAGSLVLSEDDTGLLYDVSLNPDDPNAVSVWAKVDRGDVSGSSIWFRTMREEWAYPNKSNGLEMAHRRITEYELFETGPVVFPAFTTTTAGTRSVDVVDELLRAVGVEPHKRARRAAELLASPDLETEIRALLDSAPSLRAAVCACEINGRAAHQAPGPPGTPPPGAPAIVELYNRRSQGLAARYGLPL